MLGILTALIPCYFRQDLTKAACVQTKALRRIQTTPYGSESTSAYWYENINNCAYWISVIQHPYGESDQNRIKELPSTGVTRVCKHLALIAACTWSSVTAQPHQRSAVEHCVADACIMLPALAVRHCAQMPKISGSE